MKYGVSFSFRPLMERQKALFTKRYVFDTKEARDNFVLHNIPRRWMYWPYEHNFFIKTEKER